MRLLAASALALVLAACGQRADLKPAAGNTLPVATYGREDQPSADALTKTG